MNVVAGDAVTIVKGIAVPDGHSSTNAPAPAVTASLNVTVRSASTATPVALLAGTVLSTLGASSVDGFSETDPMKAPVPPVVGS